MMIKRKITTLTTDANGRATYRYNSAGVGDINFGVDFKENDGSLVSETYTIEDCKYYCDWSKITSTWTLDTSVSGRVIYIAPHTWSEAVDMEFKFTSIPQTFFLGLKLPDALVMKYGLGRINGTWQIPYNNNKTAYISPTITTNSVVHIKSNALNSQSLYVDDALVNTQSTSNNSQGVRVDVFSGNSYELEYIKIL